MSAAAILAEIHKATRALGGKATASTPQGAYRTLERLNAHPHLLGIVGSWGDTLSDARVLAMLKDWNDGRGPLDDVIATTGHEARKRAGSADE